VARRVSASAGQADRLALLGGLARAEALLRQDAYRTAQVLLDEGVSPTLVARALGISRQQVYRAWRVPRAAS
jgi:DNA invertase Pin-like site-specific DNA recombinase